MSTSLFSYILVAFATLSLPIQAAPVFKQGTTVVRLSSEPCMSGVKKHIPAPFNEQARKAFVILKGKDVPACWNLVPSGHVVIMLSDGSAAAVALDDFEEDPGV